MVKREHPCTVGGNVNWCRHCERQYGDFLKKNKNKQTKKLEIKLSYDPKIPLLGRRTEEIIIKKKKKKKKKK